MSSKEDTAEAVPSPIFPKTTTPSVGDLSAEFAKQKRPKSPPLAFAVQPHESLAPLISPSSPNAHNSDGAATFSPIMGHLSPARLQCGETDLQVVVDQQAAAIQLLHDAFAAERQSWSLEKDRLYIRIANLEKLLKSGDGHNSPAKSPILSPLNSTSITSPPFRANSHSTRLPSIAEDEPIQSLSERRDQPRHSIDIPSRPTHQDQPAVSFDEDGPTVVIEDELAVSAPRTAELSPPPLFNRMEAGHTPLRAPRPLTPPPANALSMDGIDDTPTRNNTQLNAYISQSSDEEEDQELNGPLNMPELPNKPDDTNFTLEMLSKRLEQIEKDPSHSQPQIFAEPSPGLASPAAESENGEGVDVQRDIEEIPIAPVTTRMQASSASELSSNALSPSAALSPLSKKNSRDDDEEKAQADFEVGGIKLRKKASSNFGAPFGQLGGFGRRVSQDWQ